MRLILDIAAEQKVIIELNASPYRLDIDWRHLKYAKERGVIISINPDAHSTLGIHDVTYGIGIARKGWQEKGDVLNTMDINQVKTIFNRRKSLP